jgi:predicted dehydrogenase
MIRVGLYGINGHQIHDRLAGSTLAEVTAVAAFPEDRLPDVLRTKASLQRCQSLEEMLALPDVDAVSLCSPSRAEQARETILALEAGKHVLAEKPCALTENDLDAILAASRRTGRFFHEMAGTAYDQPYYAMREVVRAGTIGEVVQVIGEKSYPYYDGRPQDESIDGGQIGQCAVHALRFVEQVAGVPIASIHAVETTLGNPIAGGGLVMAANLLISLSNGGVASISSNYLNPRGTGIWGDESLKILGTKGLVESRAGGRFTRLVVGEQDLGPLDTSKPGVNWVDTFFGEIQGTATFPLSLDEEVSPTRWTIRARRSVIRADRPTARG